MQIWTTVCEAVETLERKEDLSPEEKAFLLLYSSLALHLLSPVERDRTAHSIEVCHQVTEVKEMSARLIFLSSFKNLPQYI